MIKLANDAVSGGADGLIMPPTMLKEMRKRYPTIPIITPGIRPEWFQDKKINHQQEISTPTEAMRDGATALVIGSPICLSNNPVDALTMILDELALNRDLTCHSISANRQINIT